jgi:choline-sulfatase
LAGDGKAPADEVITDGRSLCPHLQGHAGHDEVIGEYTSEGARAPLVMIRRGSLKFIHSPQDPDQLYDVVADPKELHNLIDRPEQAPRVAALRKEVAARWNFDDIRATVIASQRRRRFINRIIREQHIAWDYQPVMDAKNQYIRNTTPIFELEMRSRFPAVK